MASQDHAGSLIAEALSWPDAGPGEACWEDWLARARAIERVPGDERGFELLMELLQQEQRDGLSRASWDAFLHVAGQLPATGIVLDAVGTAGDAIVEQLTEQRAEQHTECNSREQEIAARYAAALHTGNPRVHDGTVSPFHLAFGRAVARRDVYALQYLANGLNEVGKAVFAEVSSLKLPRGQRATWKAMLDWAGVSEQQDQLREAQRSVELEKKSLLGSGFKPEDLVRVDHWARGLIADGFNQFSKIDHRWYLVRASDGQGIDFSSRKHRLALVRPFFTAVLVEMEAQRAVEGLQRADVLPPDERHTAPQAA